MKLLIKDNYHFHYQESGDLTKDPIIVIGSAIYYPRLFADDIYNNLHLIFIDHRGFLKPHGKNEYGLEFIVSDIEAIRKELGYEKVYLLGHSGHGFMAMSYAKQYPEHVLGLILSNLAPNNTKERQDQSIQYFEDYASSDRKNYFYEEIQALKADIKKDPQHRFSHMNIRMQAHAFYDYKFDGSYLWDNVYNNMDALDYLWGEAFATFDTKAFIKANKIPTLLVLSDYDYLVAPTSLWNSLISNTDVKLIKFNKSGHNPMLEEPKQYYEAIKLFIQNNK